jgi:hypothetical protein
MSARGVSMSRPAGKTFSPPVMRGVVALVMVCCGLACCGLAGWASQALAAAPPAVDDQAAFALGVSQFTATLNGTIDPEGVPTSYHFVYGPTPAYGLAAPSPDEYVPVNETDDAVSVVVSELQPGTIYHFALVANSPEGQSFGPDETFQTPAVPPPAVTTGNASEVSVGAVTLAGSIDPEGFETGYYFEYGTSPGYGSRWPSLDVALGGLSGAQSVVSFVEGLQPGTVYHYRLVASDPGGVGYGADATFATPEYPVSVVQEAPVLKAPLGIGSDGKSAGTKSAGKGRHKAAGRVRKRRSGAGRGRSGRGRKRKRKRGG